MHRILRLGRVAVVLVALVLFVVGVHFLHGFQLTRNAGALLNQAGEAQKQADEAKKAGDSAKAAEQFGKAAGYYGRYLGFHPDDADALAKYGFVLNELAGKSPRQKGRVFLVEEKAVRLDPSRDDVRRRLADLEVQMGRTLDARVNLEYLLKNSSPNDAELEVLLGRCEEADGHNQKAADDYELARTHDPHRVDAYVQLARVLRRRLDRAGDADGLMDEMVKRNPNSGPALLARGQYLNTAAQLAEDQAARKRLSDAAAKDIAAAQKLTPDDVEVLLTSADLKQQAGDQEGALHDLEEGWKAHPTEVRFLLGQASVELRAGQREKAVAHLRESLKILPDKADEQWTVAGMFIDAGQPDDARELLSKLLLAEGPNPVADFLQARLDVVDHKYAAAVTLLEDRRKDLAASPDLSRRMDVLLGVCYERLGNPNQQLAAYRRASEPDPSWLPARLGQASALLATGKLDEALAEYRGLARRSPEARLQAVRLSIIRNLRLPPDSRNWTDTKDLVKSAPADLLKTTDFRLTKINLLAVQGRFADAWKGLNDAIRDEPKEMRYRILQADMADFGKGRKDWKPEKTSQEILDKAEAEVGDNVDLRLARAARFARLAPKEAIKALAPLEGKVDAFDAADQKRLFAGLAEAHSQAGDLDKAVALCKQARDQSKDDLGIRLRLFDLSLVSFTAALKAKGNEGLDHDRKALQEIVDEVRGIEGVDGVFWRTCEASLLLFQAKHGGDKGGLKDARILLAEVARRRPDWSRPPLFEAELEELEGNVDAAIADYQQAIELGERQPEVIRQAARLLASRRRYSEARQVLHKLGETPPGDLGRLAVEVSLLNRDKGNVLPKAVEDAAKNSKDYHDVLWLGQVYEAMGKKAAAKAAFDQAVELAPLAPEPRAALVLLLAAENKKDEAKAALAAADKALPVDKKGPVLAVGYEALGQRDKAEEQYVALLKGKQDVADLRTAAAFYLRGGDVAKASPLLRQIIDAPGQADAEPVLWARRSLALALAGSGDYQRSKEALDLLEQNLRERNAAEDQRAKAIVLATRPGGRKDSIQALEESFARLRPTADEEFLLARLYEADRDWAHANEHFLAVVGAKGGANPFHVAYYIQALLRRNDVSEAARWLPRLEALEPDSARTLGVKARVLAKKGQGAAAALLVDNFADKTYMEKKNAAVLGDAASLLEQLERPVEAEKKYREYVKAVEAEQPEKTLVLAGFLARQDRLTESLDVIEGVWAKCKPETAARTAVAALRIGHPKPQHYQRVESLLQDAIAKNPAATNLLVSLADLRDAQGKYGEAERAYREILSANPRNPLALNNLAWLLAFQPGKGAEALDLVDRRVNITGPSASVLDTRGMILLKMGRAAEAVPQFSDAASQKPAAVYYFHLAEAQKAVGKSNEAEKAWLKAKELGFKKTNLDALELKHPDYDEKWFEEDTKN